MRNKQHANGTTPVVRLTKKSAFHDLAFDTNISVPCEREYTEQFAPRRDQIVFVFHDEFARMAQQLVNKTCHSTNTMHKMKMDPKTYTITDSLRFDTSAPVVQLPLSRQIRANTTLSVEKRDHRSDVIPANDHTRKLMDVRPSNPHSYHDATQIGVKPPFDAKYASRIGDTRPSNPHSYHDATHIGVRQPLETKPVGWIDDTRPSNPYSYHESARMGRRAVSLTSVTPNPQASLPIKIDVSQQHLQRATNQGTVVKRSIITPIASAITRKIVRASCNAGVPRQARAMKSPLVVHFPTFTVHKIRECNQPESVITSARYTKLTPQSTNYRTVHDARGAFDVARGGVGGVHSGGMVREPTNPPTYVVTHADLEASSAFTSERVEQHAPIHANPPHYSISTQSHSMGRIEDMPLAPGGGDYKLHGTLHGALHGATAHAAIHSVPELSPLIADFVSSDATRAHPTTHYTHIALEQDVVQPHMSGGIDRTRIESRPNPALATMLSFPEYETPRPSVGQVPYYEHTSAVEYQPMHSFDDARAPMTTTTQNTELHRIPSAHAVQTRKSALARNPIGHPSLSAGGSDTPLDIPLMVNSTLMTTGTTSGTALSRFSDASHVDGRVVSSASSATWSGDVRPALGSVDARGDHSSEHHPQPRLPVQTPMNPNGQPSIKWHSVWHADARDGEHQGHVRAETTPHAAPGHTQYAPHRGGEIPAHYAKDVRAETTPYVAPSHTQYAQAGKVDHVRPTLLDASPNVHMLRYDHPTHSQPRDWDMDGDSMRKHATTSVHSTSNRPVHIDHRVESGLATNRNATAVESQSSSHRRPTFSCQSSPDASRNNHHRVRVDTAISDAHRPGNVAGAYTYIKLNPTSYSHHARFSNHVAQTHRIDDTHTTQVPSLDGTIQLTNPHNPHRPNAELATLPATKQDNRTSRIPASTVVTGSHYEPVGEHLGTRGQQSTSDPGHAPVSATTRRDTAREHSVSMFQVKPTHATYERIVLSGTSGASIPTPNGVHSQIHSNAEPPTGASRVLSIHPTTNHERSHAVAVDDVQITMMVGGAVASSVDTSIHAMHASRVSVPQPSLDSSVRAVKTIQRHTDPLVGISMPHYAAGADARPKSVPHGLSIRERACAPSKRDVISNTPFLEPKRESIQFKSKGVVHKRT